MFWNHRSSTEFYALKKCTKKKRNETPRCGKEGSLLAISRLARDYCRLNTTSGPRLDNPSPAELPAALYLLCKSFSCEPARRRGETRAAMGKNPILSKWISPSKKNKKTHLPPPNNCTTYNASQTKQSSPNLKSDILHFPECYGTSESMLDRQAGSCSSRKTKPNRN